MMVIDAHVHLYPAELNRDPAGWGGQAGEPHWARLCTRLSRGRPVQGFPFADRLLREMDAVGIERAVLVGWYWEKPETCAWQNRFYAACIRAHPDRFSAFVALGECSPHSQGYAMDDPAFAEILALAAELHLPVNLHVTDPAGKNYPGRVETPL